MFDYFISNVNYISFILCSLLGGVAHYLKKYAKGETTVGMSQWFGRSNLPASLYTGIVFFFIVVGTISSGVITAEMNFWTAMYSGFMTGLAIDSTINSDESKLNRSIIDLQTDLHTIRQLGEDQKQEDAKGIADEIDVIKDES